MSNKLEEAAIAARNKLIAVNYYDNVDDANNYGATHTRALSDELQTQQIYKAPDTSGNDCQVSF